MHNLPQTLETANFGAGHNSEAALKELAAQGRKAIKAYDKACKMHRKGAFDAHIQALALGKVLYEGKQLFPSTKAYGVWISKNGFDAGSLGSQTELNACAHLYQRVILNKEFTLEGCDLTVPTNIMKWARRNHAHLFDQKPRVKKRDRALIDQIIAAVQETPLDVGAKLFEALKGSKELASFKRALMGKAE